MLESVFKNHKKIKKNRRCNLIKGIHKVWIPLIRNGIDIKFSQTHIIKKAISK